jgi:PST family polysaccharide transporter
MLVFRSGESLYGVGNAFLLGLFAPPTLVGYFASAEKLSRAAFGLLNPIRETLYPRISRIIFSLRQRGASGPNGAPFRSTLSLTGLSLLLFAP